jgi:Ca-activated chloride channel family protein
VELVLGLGEDVEPMARRLLARTVAPLITGLGLAGPGVLATAPLRLPDVYAGAPALFAVELLPGTRSVTVQGATARGPYSATAEAQWGGSPAVAALFGREQVEDLELSLAAGAQAAEVDASLERLGLEFQLSTRLTSWVAVSEQATVDPRQPSRREVMPQALPHGVSAEGVGLRSATRMFGAATPVRMFGASPPAAAGFSRELMGQYLGRRGASERPALAPPEEREFSKADAAPPEDQLGVEPTRGAPPRRSRSSKGRQDVLAAPPAPAPAPAVRVLAARVVRATGGELLLEVELTGLPLDWAPGATVELELERGLTGSATVVPARTTGPGAYAPGLVLRLCLAMEPGWAVQAVLLPGAVPVRLEVR